MTKNEQLAARDGCPIDHCQGYMGGAYADPAMPGTATSPPKPTGKTYNDRAQSMDTEAKLALDVMPRSPGPMPFVKRGG